jgi:hypothetical protein
LVPGEFASTFEQRTHFDNATANGLIRRRLIIVLCRLADFRIRHVSVYSSFSHKNAIESEKCVGKEVLQKCRRIVNFNP